MTGPIQPRPSAPATRDMFRTRAEESATAAAKAREISAQKTHAEAAPEGAEEE